MSRPPVYLVACAKTKAAQPCAAKDLYRSDWFRKARAYVEAQSAPWFILSARHGLLDPDAVVAPYEANLPRMCKLDRRAWATKVHHALFAKRLLPVFGRRIVFLAGAVYREHLEPGLTLNGRDPGAVETPMRGLGLGQQLAWLTAHGPQLTPTPPSPVAASPAHEAIEPMLVISTAHVRPATMEGLAAGERGGPAPHRVIPHAYGAIVYVGEPPGCAGFRPGAGLCLGQSRP